MVKGGRVLNAGWNEIYGCGIKAVGKAALALKANKNGYLSIPVDGGEYWAIGTSAGKYGEYCRMCGTIFSVNKYGKAYAKADTEKGEAFLQAVVLMINQMVKGNRKGGRVSRQSGTGDVR